MPRTKDAKNGKTYHFVVWYKENPADEEEEPKKKYYMRTEDITADFVATHCNGTSNGGTGGMGQKLENAQKALASGVSEVWIVNGKDPAQLHAVLNGEHAGTRIIKQNA